MSSQKDSMTREDIKFFTALLRNDDGWSDLRNDLEKEGFDVSTLLVPYHYESEECREYGAIVTRSKQVFQFVREPVPETADKRRFISFRDITNNSKAIDDDREHIEMALEMVDEESNPSIA